MSNQMDPQKTTLPCPSCGRPNRVALARLDHGPKCGHCGARLVADQPVSVTDQTFRSVVGGSDIPVLVDFYADWCGPCKVMAPLLDQVAKERAGRVVVAKLDTDRSPQTAGGFNIRGIPTLIGFINGREAGREVGAVPKPRIEALVDSLLRQSN